MANDLRAIIAMSKAVAELERAGDEAKKIARAVLGRGSAGARYHSRCPAHRAAGREPAAPFTRGIRPHRSRRAAEVIARDEELDAEVCGGPASPAHAAMEDPRHFDVTLEAAFVLKSLERIGDHARNAVAMCDPSTRASAASGAGRTSSGRPSGIHSS